MEHLNPYLNIKASHYDCQYRKFDEIYKIFNIFIVFLRILYFNIFALNVPLNTGLILVN